MPFIIFIIICAAVLVYDFKEDMDFMAKFKERINNLEE